MQWSSPTVKAGVPVMGAGFYLQPISWAHFKDVRGLGTVWFPVANWAHQLTERLASG
jgi:hypothetical protein